MTDMRVRPVVSAARQSSSEQEPCCGRCSLQSKVLPVNPIRSHQPSTRLYPPCWFYYGFGASSGSFAEFDVDVQMTDLCLDGALDKIQTPRELCSEHLSETRERESYTTQKAKKPKKVREVALLPDISCDSRRAAQKRCGVRSKSESGEFLTR